MRNRIRLGVVLALLILGACAAIALAAGANPSFSFSSDEPGIAFTCKLDGGSASACSSPKTYSNLAPGPHTETIVGKFTVPNPPPPASGSVLLGNQMVQGTHDGSSSPASEAFGYTASADGTASSVSVYLDSTDGATVGLYADDFGKPGTLLDKGSIASNAAGWATVPLPGNVTVANGTRYWIAVGANAGGNVSYRDMGSSGSNLDWSGSGFASPYGASAQWNSNPISAYVSGTVASSTSSSSSSTTTSTTSTQTSSETTTTSSSGGTPMDCLQVSGNQDPYATSLTYYPDYRALDSCGYPSPDTAGVGNTPLTTISSGTRLPAGWSYSSTGELMVGAGGTLSDVALPNNYVGIDTSEQVTFDHVLIRCGACTSGSPMVNLLGNHNVTFKYSTLGGTGGGSDCTGYTSTDIGNGSATLDHDVLDCGINEVNGSGFTITDSYLMDDGNPGPQTHNEPIYVPGGGSATVKHDTILAPVGDVAGIFMDAKSPMGPITVENSLFSGGIGNAMIAGGGPNVTIATNRFSDAYKSATAIVMCSGTNLSGNYWDNSLLPVNPLNSTSC